jgi:hypothetical protein
MNKSMQDASAARAGNAYVARRLGARQVEGASLQEVWDHRPHEGRGGKGTIAQAVWKLKVVWDHAGTGTVRSRDIHQQISRAEKRLEKLNVVEAARLTQAGAVLSTAIRSCQGQEEVGEAMMAAEEGVRGGTHLAVVRVAGQALADAAGPSRAKRGVNAQQGPARQTRGSAARAGVTLASAAARREEREAETAAADQALQESGPEGRSILVERGAEVQEGGRVLLEALRNRDPGFLEKVRTVRGQWVTAGDEAEEMGGVDDKGEGKEWEGWEEVLTAWAAVGSVAASTNAYGLDGPEPGVA